jgi:hypothetical protein
VEKANNFRIKSETGNDLLQAPFIFPHEELIGGAFWIIRDGEVYITESINIYVGVRLYIKIISYKSAMSFYQLTLIW